MRTIACKTVWALLVGVSLVLSLNSCSKDPVIPEDETKNKLHEDPAKMTVRLVECRRSPPKSGIPGQIYETCPGDHL